MKTEPFVMSDYHEAMSNKPLEYGYDLSTGEDAKRMHSDLVKIKRYLVNLHGGSVALTKGNSSKKGKIYITKFQGGVPRIKIVFPLIKLNSLSEVVDYSKDYLSSFRKKTRTFMSSNRIESMRGKARMTWNIQKHTPRETLGVFKSIQNYVINRNNFLLRIEFNGKSTISLHKEKKLLIITLCVSEKRLEEYLTIYKTQENGEFSAITAKEILAKASRDIRKSYADEGGL